MNHRSLRPRVAGRLFTLLLAMLAWPAMLWPTVASADRLVLYPVGGNASEERIEQVEAMISAIAQEQGHRIVAPIDRHRPRDRGAMEGAASTGHANYVLVAEVAALPGQYQLTLLVYYAPAARLEELVVSVVEEGARQRISDVISSMVRSQGLGEDAVRLTAVEEDPVDQTAADLEAEAARQAEAERLAEEEAARLAEEEARRAEEAEREAAEQQRTAATAFEDRTLYGTDGRWLVQLGAGGHGLVPLGALPAGAQGGGGLFDVNLRLGRSFEGLPGVELRGGLNFVTGGLSGLGLHVGGAYLASLFTEPFYIGAEAELGLLFTFTGSRDVAFSARAAAVFAYRPTEHVYLEAALPQIGVLTAGSGALTLGASLRAGYRF